jgi:hypothetical protein
METASVVHVTKPGGRCHLVTTTAVIVNGRGDWHLFEPMIVQFVEALSRLTPNLDSLLRITA